MRFIPNSAFDREKLLKVAGVESVDELFSDIPADIYLRKALSLPSPLPEMDLAAHFEGLAGENHPVNPGACFLGAGAYPHYTPVAVDQLLLRSEFFTCYTPYQAEVSQGTLMAAYEYQTYTAALLGMDVANSSMYDGASAMAEALVMAHRVTGKPKVVLSNLVHPHWREVASTYTHDLDMEIVTIDCLEPGVSSVDAMGNAVDDTTCALVVQSPNFLGNIEDLTAIRTLCDKAGALMIVAVAEPVCLGLLEGPGRFGADIAVAEGRSFGGSLSFGGPGLGMFAVKKELVRKMPGRLVGKTVDSDGRNGYVLTLATREQHIRREKATSNICSNQSLCATSAAIHISLLGEEGMRELATRNLSSAGYMLEKITSINGFDKMYDQPFFNETVIKTPVAPALINRRLQEEGIQGGLDLSRYYPQLGSAILFCATEVHCMQTIDRMAGILSEFGQ